MQRKNPGKRQAKKPAKQAGAKKSGQKFRQDPLFGAIPLLPVEYRYQDHVTIGWTPDLDWRPELPPGAIRGNPRAQVYCSMCHAPRYFYLDEPRHCVQCGRDFIFAAEEQRFWYEQLKFNFHSTAIRCPDCRRKRRSAKALQAALSEAADLVRSAPKDPQAQLAFAEALTRYRDQTASGDIDKALAAARRARKLNPAMGEAWFWEAEAQRLKGEANKAVEAYVTYLGSTGTRPGLVKEAREHLKVLKPDEK